VVEEGRGKGNHTHLAGRMRASNSVFRCRRIMFLDGGMPRAVAMVSPEKDGSNTTSPPWTPLSVTVNGRIVVVH